MKGFQSNQRIDSSLISSNNGGRQEQFYQEESKPKTISNRQKILNLHQRIKMLDQINLERGRSNDSPSFMNSKSSKEIIYSEEKDDEEQKNQRIQKTFLKSSLSPNPQLSNKGASLSNLSNFFRSKNDNQIERPNTSLNNPRTNAQITNQTYLNKNIGSQQSLSASRLPSYSPINKNIQEPQNIANSMFRSPQMSQVTQLYPLQAKYLSIQDKFLHFKLSQQNLLKNIESEIQELQQNCKQIKKESEKSQKRNEQLIETLQKSLIGEINDLSSELKEVKSGAIESLNTKHKAIRSETIAMISEEFQSQCKTATNEIQTQLQVTHKQLQKEQILRDETSQFLIHSFGDEIIKLEEVFNKQREARIRKNDEILKLMNRIEVDLMDKLKKEKSEMVQTIDYMQSMLQQVCYKIQEKILGK